MTGKILRLVPALITLLLGSAALAQTVKTEHTYKLDDPDTRVPASLDDVAWMVGSWSGEAFGGTFEQTWNPASVGSMVGMFKLINDGKVNFYELLLLVEAEGSLSLKVKHFTPEFTAWEEKDDFVHFRLVGVGSGVVHFSGLSFYQVSDDEMHAYIAMHNQDKVWEEKLVYRRSKSSPSD